jgi:hypothetical protein
MDTFTLSTNELANGGLGSGRGRAAGATLLLTNQGNTKIRLLRGDRGRRRCITVETVSAVRRQMRDGPFPLGGLRGFLNVAPGSSSLFRSRSVPGRFRPEPERARRHRRL